MKFKLALCLTFSAASLAGCATTAESPVSRAPASATKLRCKTMPFNEDKAAPEVQADGFFLKRFDLEPAQTPGDFTMRNRTYYAKDSNDSKKSDNAESVASNGSMFESPIGEGFKYSWHRYRIGSGALTLMSSDNVYYFGTLTYGGANYGFVTCSAQPEETASSAPARPSEPEGASLAGKACKTMDEARDAVSAHSAKIKAFGDVTGIMAVSGARTKTCPIVQVNVTTAAAKAKIEKAMGKSIDGFELKVVASGVVRAQ